MSADTDAFKAVQQLPGLTPAEQQYLLTGSRGEGFYGLGWGNPNKTTIAESAKFGIDPRAGVGSNNWGAEQGSGSAGFFPHVDSHSDGTFYVEKYKRHATPVEGAASMARILLKPNVKAALNTGIYQGPVMRFAKPNASQLAQFNYKKQFSGFTLTPLMAAVLTQSDNGYYELHPEKYLEAVKRNYATLTASLKWPNLLSKEMIASLPLELNIPGSQSLELQDLSSGEHSESPEPESNVVNVKA